MTSNVNILIDPEKHFVLEEFTIIMEKFIIQEIVEKLLRYIQVEIQILFEVIPMRSCCTGQPIS